MSQPDWFQLIAETRGVPPDWRWFKLEAIDNAVLVTGAVCTARYQRGKRKGSMNWSKRDKATARQLIITRDEQYVFEKKWEHDTGKCSGCGGSGKQVQSVGTAGTTYRECRKCSGTGSPANKAGE